MRILIMTDSLFLPSGLAKVGREIAVGLAAHGHEIGYIGWWHRSDIVRALPQGITYWPTDNRYYGSDIFDNVIQNYEPEIVLTIGDMWNVSYVASTRTRRLFQWCAYISVDGEPIGGGLPPSLVPIVEDVDIPVAYTDYAKNTILKSVKDPETRLRIRTIYHGVDTDMFRQAKFEERRAARQALGIDDKFVFLTVLRNQTRKNIPELFRAWKLFSESEEAKGQVILWPHTFFRDAMGWPIDNILEILGLKDKKNIMYYRQVAYAPSEFHLMPEAKLAELYRIADAFILIAGEGFGLPTFEAMATGLPCILLDCAASSELGADGRAELVPCGDCQWTGIHLTQRMIPSPEAIAEAMMKVFKDPIHAGIIARNGMKFAGEYSWKNIIGQWSALFTGYEIPFAKPVAFEEVTL